jgi:hypothetical protein
MSLLSLEVTVAGSVRPNKPITPLQIAKLVGPYVGKKFVVNIASNQTPQQLADMVDILLGLTPGQTFDETLIQAGGNRVLDKNMTLEENNLKNGDKIMYRFYIILN